MTGYKVEKNVPMEKRVKYPFSKMEIGDSFYIEFREVPKIRSAAYVYGGKNNQKFSGLKEGKGYRIWRTE